jgi:predicted amidohydrolase
LTSGPAKDDNLAKADRLVERAAAEGARVVVLPEKWNGVGNAAAMHELAEPLAGGETVETMSGWARRHDIWVVGGSITERREGRERLSNTCCVFAPGGELSAVYRRSAARSTASPRPRSRARSRCSSRRTAGGSG